MTDGDLKNIGLNSAVIYEDNFLVDLNNSRAELSEPYHGMVRPFYYTEAYNFYFLHNQGPQVCNLIHLWHCVEQSGAQFTRTPNQALWKALQDKEG